jgi:hypothetical protein
MEGTEAERIGAERGELLLCFTGDYEYPLKLYINRGSRSEIAAREVGKSSEFRG